MQQTVLFDNLINQATVFTTESQSQISILLTGTRHLAGRLGSPSCPNEFDPQLYSFPVSTTNNLKHIYQMYQNFVKWYNISAFYNCS